MPKGIKYIFIGAAVLCLIAVWSYNRGINAVADPAGDAAAFTVSPGESVDDIGRHLYDAGLIGSTLYFKTYVRSRNEQAALQAGDYALSPAFSIRKIVDILTKGQTEGKERTIKIIEGWDIDEMDDYLQKNNVISDDIFSSLAKSEIGNWKSANTAGGLEIVKPDFLQDAPATADLEGYLFPDTYRIYKDATAGDIIAKMLDNFGNKLTPQMRADIAAQNKTIYEIITMASVVEKEVRTEEDMKIVSGIFWDRIKNGQPLESCATLAYILGVDKKQYTLEDTEVNSPYNTYQHQGLPPGPITNPGLAAIKAAIYPEYTDFNYFLSRPDTGETVFGRTYEEHLINKARYLQ
jgi:UPF0755 protein